MKSLLLLHYLGKAIKKGSLIFPGDGLRNCNTTFEGRLSFSISYTGSPLSPWKILYRLTIYSLLSILTVIIAIN